MDTRQSADAEFLESMKLSSENTARVFGVPPTTFGFLDHGACGNAGQETQPIIQNSLGLVATRVGAPTSQCLLEPDARRRIYLEHNLSGFLRRDAKSRSEICRMIREIGDFLAGNMRRRVNGPPIDSDGDCDTSANSIPVGMRPKASGVV